MTTSVRRSIVLAVVVLLASVTGCTSSTDDRSSVDPAASIERGGDPPAAAEPSAPTPPTAPTATTTEPSSPLVGRTIVLDPGHAGGNATHAAEISREVFIGTGWKACDTSGTQTHGGYPEHVHNWDVARRTEALLRAAGAEVVLTRTDDDRWGPCIDERARIGNDAAADAVVSIHADGGPDGGRGFHVLHPTAVTPQSAAIAEPSRRLAIAVRDAFGRITGMPTSTYLGSSGLMPRGDLGGLNLSTVPKVFLEAGNMRNATDAALLSDPGFRQAEAEAIVTGLVVFLGGG
ncbi:MAG: N-acetylmuramoyl-L-alanine amidase [Acidimicrobiia bacterium]|nr:N-acetylmuramoyl-L-alanine amidase [Acidimicrobiia bacterium]